MIEKILLNNFKLHKNTALTLANLTLLAGVNGMGKSSVFQSLLLLRQSYFSNQQFKNGLILNGDLVEIGTAKNLFSINMEAEDTLDIFLRITGMKNWLKWQVKNQELDKNYLSSSTKRSFPQFSLVTNDFQYISSQRIAPAEIHLRNDLLVGEKKQISIKEGQCELAVHFLNYYQRNTVPPEIRHSSIETEEKLLSQVNAWMKEISPDLDIVIQESNLTNSFILHFRYFQEKFAGYTPEFTPENVGYGISQALPIIIAVLAAPKGSLILIENPEAHLHPRGQAKLMELLCKAAQYGIQIIIETHSDHIINGILVQCKHFREEQFGIDQRNVKIYYFDREEGEHTAKVTELNILENEKIINPPNGFFDQIRKDRRFLIGF